MIRHVSIGDVCAIIFVAFMFAYYAMGVVMMLLYKPGDWHYFAKEEAVIVAQSGSFASRLCPGIILSMSALIVSLVFGWGLLAVAALINMTLYAAFVCWLRSTKP